MGRVERAEKNMRVASRVRTDEREGRRLDDQLQGDDGHTHRAYVLRRSGDLLNEEIAELAERERLLTNKILAAKDELRSALAQ